MTSKGNEISPARMPLMRIRSVEIVFEDELSTCMDTGLLDKSLGLISDSSDDSTKCVEDLDHLQERNDITLNAEADLSDDNSVSLTQDLADDMPKATSSFNDDSTRVQCESVTLAIDDVTPSLNVSEVVDSGRFTQDASSSHLETVPISYDDALLSRSVDVINFENSPTVMSMYEISEACSASGEKGKLYEYIVTDSDSSESDPLQQQSTLDLAPEEDELTVCDTSDLQYDSIVDMGKF